MPENTNIDRLLSDGSYINNSDQGRRAVQVLNEADPHNHITGYTDNANSTIPAPTSVVPAHHHITGVTDTNGGWQHTIHSDGLGTGQIGLDDPRL